VAQLRSKPADLSVDQDLLMHFVIRESAKLAAKQTNRGTPAVAVPKGSSEHMALTLDTKCRLGWIARQDTIDFLAQLFRDDLIGINGQQPLAMRLLYRELFLLAETAPVRLYHIGRVAPADLNGAVFASAVNNDDLPRPAGEGTQA
jgi:hypothetical protein